MKQFFLFLSLLATQYTHAQLSVKVDSSWLRGRYYTFKGGPFDEAYISFFYRRDSSGKRNGKASRYLVRSATDSTLLFSGNFNDNWLYGQNTWYYPSGNKYVQGNFEKFVHKKYFEPGYPEFPDFNYRAGDVFMLEMGEPVGDFVSYYDTAGNPVERVLFFRNGQLDGISYEYYPNGRLHWKAEYHNNKKNGMAMEYDRGGREQGQGNYSEGSKSGTWIERGPGAGKTVCNYSDGKLNGSYHRFDSLGRICESGCYRDGLADGELLTWYSNGILKERSWFKKGRQDSMYVSFHPNGMKCTEGKYEEGIPVGKWKDYAANGKLLRVYDPEKITPVYPVDAVVDELEQVWVNVEEEAGLFSFLDERLSAHKGMLRDGPVHVHVHVSRDGHVNMELLTAVSEKCRREFEQFASTFPAIIPQKEQGRPVEVDYFLTLSYSREK